MRKAAPVWERLFSFLLYEYRPMNHRFPLVVLIALAFAGCQPEPAHELADIALMNAYVYTADDLRTVADAVAIRGKDIVYVGSNEGVQQFVGNSTIVRDMGGAMLMPGIHDMHIHALGTVEPDMCDLASNAYSLEELVPVLKQCIDDFDIAEGDWLIVLQWAFSSGNEPSDQLPHIRAALDAVSTDHPIFMYGDDGHHWCGKQSRAVPGDKRCR